MDRRKQLAALVALCLFAGAGDAYAEQRLPTWIDPDEPESAEAGCDAGADGEVDDEELVADEPPDRTIPTPAPTQWREARGRDCQRHRGRRVCDGPLRVPEPHGEDAARARELGLDESRAGRVAMNEAPPAAWLAAAPPEVGPGLLWPVPEGRLWRGFGRHRAIVRRRGGGRLVRARRRFHQHQGVDIGAAEGTPIRAVNAGLVLYSFNGMRGYGNSVLLLHGDGSVSLYAHCRATYVFAGQRVARGQVIAEVGDTGLAHGAHLHFEWRRDGRALDPLEHFVGREPEPAAQPVAAAPTAP